MFFTIKRSFDYQIRKGNICQHGQCLGPLDLVDVMHNSLNYNSFELGLTRTFFIQKADKSTDPKIIDSENLNIIVMDKLIYPKQVRELLIKKYNDTFDFDELNLPVYHPVYFGGVLEREELGPINPNTGDKTTYTRRYVQCRSLKEGDIVVDKHLHRMWREKTHFIPADVIQFFSERVTIH